MLKTIGFKAPKPPMRASSRPQHWPDPHTPIARPAVGWGECTGAGPCAFILGDGEESMLACRFISILYGTYDDSYCGEWPLDYDAKE
jgi:hypothetical protein